jgi:hypothetical protein
METCNNCQKLEMKIKELELKNKQLQRALELDYPLLHNELLDIKFILNMIDSKHIESFAHFVRRAKKWSDNIGDGLVNDLNDKRARAGASSQPQNDTDDMSIHLIGTVKNGKVCAHG